MSNNKTKKNLNTELSTFKKVVKDHNKCTDYHEECKKLLAKLKTTREECKTKKKDKYKCNIKKVIPLYRELEECANKNCKKTAVYISNITKKMDKEYDKVNKKKMKCSKKKCKKELNTLDDFFKNSNSKSNNIKTKKKRMIQLKKNMKDTIECEKTNCKKESEEFKNFIKIDKQFFKIYKNIY